MKEINHDIEERTVVAPMNTELKMPLTAALQHIADKLGLCEGETIQIDCYLDEARELQAIVNRWEGATLWDNAPGADAEKEIDDYRFECLLDLLKEHDLCIQFIDTYPCVSGDNNMRVLVSERKTAEERLEACKGTLGMILARKALAQSAVWPRTAQAAPGGSERSVTTTPDRNALARPLHGPASSGFEALPDQPKAELGDLAPVCVGGRPAVMESAQSMISSGK
jgi:hypothetical protein